MINNYKDLLRKIKPPFFNSLEVFFDIGTTETKIAIKDKGVILREPTVIGFNEKINEYIFFGTEAKSIIGKVPDYIKIIKPVVNGVITDFDGATALISKYLEKSVNLYLKTSFFKPLINGFSVIPSIATEIEQKAIEEVLYKNKINEIFLIEKAIATAAGCQINVFSNEPHLVIDLGGGLIEINIVGSGGIISQRTLKNAGDSMNKQIYNYLYLKYGIILGENTCEFLKINLLNFNNQEKTIPIRGKALENSLPKTVKIKTSDIKEALLVNFNLILDNIKEVIESTAPEIIDEITKNGIFLTGGLSKIEGIEKFFSQELKIDVYKKDSLLTTINGLIELSKNKDLLSKLIIKRIS